MVNPVSSNQIWQVQFFLTGPKLNYVGPGPNLFWIMLMRKSLAKHDLQIMSYISKIDLDLHNLVFGQTK